MNFLQRHARFILPAPWLFLACLNLWQAWHGQGGAVSLPFYLQALGWTGVAALSYWGQLSRIAKREQEAAAQ